MKTPYIPPRTTSYALHATQSLLANSFVSVGGGTDHFDSNRRNEAAADFAWEAPREDE
ncbi:MAG: hypothetical protein MR446_00505 [Bacteroidales bacterium]|nr:hypothetical protein [Bacteroidales bacterium]